MRRSITGGACEVDLRSHKSARWGASLLFPQPPSHGPAAHLRAEGRENYTAAEAAVPQHLEEGRVAEERDLLDIGGAS